MASPKNDGWLAAWLDEIEASGEISIVLFVNGMAISGQVISPMEYYRGLGEKLADAVDGAGEDSGAEVRDYFSQLADQSAEGLRRSSERLEHLLENMPSRFEDRTPEQDEALERLSRNYIHLRNTVAIMGGNMRINAGLWRGRLSEVAGWSLGSPDP